MARRQLKQRGTESDHSGARRQRGGSRRELKCRAASAACSSHRATVFQDLLAEKPGQRVAVEIETGKSDITANIEKTVKARFDRVVLVATSPAAAVACTRLVDGMKGGTAWVEVLTWLGVS